jgi:glucosamine--fructose-6-phosphate aminotransferase (isomerizing)
MHQTQSKDPDESHPNTSTLLHHESLMPPDPTPFPHWMLREIHEQPETLAATLAALVADNRFRDEAAAPLRAWLRAAQAEIVIAASGSSRHAGLVAELLFEDLAAIAVDVEYASEYVYRSSRTRQNASVLLISQSGETADTLAALRKAATEDHPTLAITNVPTSTMTREADVSFPTAAGRELAIPATKSFTAQLLNLYLLALLAAELRHTLTPAEIAARLAELSTLPARLRAQLPAWQTAVAAIAQHYTHAQSFLFLGRGVHYAIAREGALKLKESAYLHAEGYPSGELKHGPNALVSEGTPLVMLATYDPNDLGSVARYEKVLHLMCDMRSQGADILAILNTGDTEAAALATHTLFVDPASESVLPILEVVPLQLFAYYMAIQRGIDVDHPRNLTKAVLAE